MPSPDASAYVDLRLLDRDPQAVVEAALANLQSYAPEWTPREGHTEVLLLESLALEVSEAIFTINRLPGAVVEVLLRLYGVTRDPGLVATTTLQFTLSDTAGHVLPAGVRAALILPAPLAPVVFTTTAALTIAAGTRVGTVAAVADRRTADANGRDAGTAMQLLDAITFVERVQLGSSVVGGATEENDQAWFSRGITRLGRLSETLVLPRHFMAVALETAEVTRALVIDNYNPAAVGLPGSHPGFVTVAVYGAGGPLPSTSRTALQDRLQGSAQANLAVRVVDPTVTVVPVNVTVMAMPGHTAVAVSAAVTAVLDGYLAPETWAWGSTVYRNELIAVIDGAAGVQRVVTITAPAADLVLSGVAPLADRGTVTVTVQLP